MKTKLIYKIPVKMDQAGIDKLDNLLNDQAFSDDIDRKYKWQERILVIDVPEEGTARWMRRTGQRLIDKGMVLTSVVGVAEECVRMAKADLSDDGLLAFIRATGFSASEVGYEMSRLMTQEMDHLKEIH